jgi:hypothetical protein
MKIKVNLPTKPEQSPVFLDVARLITPEPPQWLPLVLAHFAPDPEVKIGDDWLAKKMIGAVDDLLRYLPVFEHMGPLTGEVQQVRIVLRLLPGIRRDLERALRQGTGRPPDIGKQICAAVMLEAWRLARGDVEPHSAEFREACGRYWRACGGKVFWKAGNSRTAWREQIDNALKSDRGSITDIMTDIVGKTP